MRISSLRRCEFLRCLFVNVTCRKQLPSTYVHQVWWYAKAFMSYVWQNGQTNRQTDGQVNFDTPRYVHFPSFNTANVNFFFSRFPINFIFRDKHLLPANVRIIYCHFRNLVFFLLQIDNLQNANLTLVTLQDTTTQAKIRVKLWGAKETPLVVGQQAHVKNLAILCYEGVINANTTPSTELQVMNHRAWSLSDNETADNKESGGMKTSRLLPNSLIIHMFRNMVMLHCSQLNRYGVC